MKKSFLLLSLIALLNFNNSSKGDGITNIPRISNDAFKQSCIKHQLLKLIDEINQEEEEASYLIRRNLSKYFGNAERSKVREIAKEIGIDPKWIYEIIWYESRGNPKAVNKQPGDPENAWLRVLKGRATGVIQFMPKTAKKLGTTTKDLFKMSVLEQLDYVRHYLKHWDDIYDLTTYEDTYLSVFYPYALGKPDTYVIGTGIITDQNPTVDTNNDGVITVKDFKEYSIS